MCDHPNREEAMVTVCYDGDGTPTVWCDPCIADLVGALNEVGMYTKWSCCGHGRQPTVVGLDDGRQVVVLTLDQVHAISEVFPEINELTGHEPVLVPSSEMGDRLRFIAKHAFDARPDRSDAERVDITLDRKGRFHVHIHRSPDGSDEPTTVLEGP